MQSSSGRTGDAGPGSGSGSHAEGPWLGADRRCYGNWVSLVARMLPGSRLVSGSCGLRRGSRGRMGAGDAAECEAAATGAWQLLSCLWRMWRREDPGGPRTPLSLRLPFASGRSSVPPPPVVRVAVP